MFYYYGKSKSKIFKKSYKTKKTNVKEPFAISKTIWYFLPHIILIIGLDLVAASYVKTLAAIFQDNNTDIKLCNKGLLCKDLCLFVLYSIIATTIIKKYLVNKIKFYINTTFIQSVKYFDVGHIDFHGSDQIINYKDKISEASVDIIYHLLFTISSTTIGIILMFLKNQIGSKTAGKPIFTASAILIIVLSLGYLIQLNVQKIINKLYSINHTSYHKSISQLIKLYTFYNFYGVHQYQINRMLLTNNKNYNKSKKHDIFSKLNNKIYQLIFAIYAVLLIYYFQYNMQDIGKLFAFSISIIQLLNGIMTIYFNYYVIQDASKFFNKLQKNHSNKKQTDIQQINQIILKNIGYKVKNLNIISKINGSIKKHDIIGLVGPSGCGKSTLLKILIGLKEPTQGSILINGKFIDNFKLTSLMKQFTYISQNDNILSGETLKYNITLGQDFSDKEVYEILNQVGLLDWSKSLPQKLNTIIGENASNISGGQRKRIQIARALLSSIHNSSIIILDEPTVGMDHISAAQCIEIIMNIAKKNQQIVIITSHNIKLINKIVNKYIFCDSNQKWTFGTYENLHQKSQDFRNYFANIKHRIKTADI